VTAGEKGAPLMYHVSEHVTQDLMSVAFLLYRLNVLQSNNDYANAVYNISGGMYKIVV
jgi:hypothetical protein